MDFAYSPKVQELRERVTAFMDAYVYPAEPVFERQVAEGDRWQPTAIMEELKARAKAEGLWNLFLPESELGAGLSNLEYAPLAEIMGRSLLGPEPFNCSAPDTGNMEVLVRYATQAQKQQWLEPLLRGEIRSAFAMTEPDNGAGSDPSLMKVTAEKRGDKFVINGRKWLITGYPGASLVIVMAKTLDTDGTDLGATMFLVPMDTPGMKLVEMHNTMDSNSPGGHAIIDFQDLEVPVEDVLGDVGQGFRNAQVRLAPARMTHCMRWLGQARRCHDIAAGHANYRKAFGKTIGQHQGIGFQLADSEIELNLCRLAIWHCCWLLDRGEQARSEVSQCKVFCSEALGRVVDRSLQVLGGMGIMDTTIIERTYRDIRAFRIYDGPSEVHRHVLARGIAKAAGQ